MLASISCSVFETFRPELGMREPSDVTLPYAAVWTAFLVWALALTYRAVRTVTDARAPRVIAAYLAYLAVALVSAWMPEERTWRTSDEDEPVKTAAPGRAKAIGRDEAEDVMTAQAELVRAETAKLRRGRKGVVDLYFVGFAGHSQDVFLQEVVYARELFDERFDTRGRSVVLVNNARTKETLPIASLTNLRATLADVAKAMNPGEDVLFLWLASHGAKEHELSVRNGSLPLRQLGTDALVDALKRAGIEWRVIVVDACYSGGFVEPLKDDRTMVMTSASADHKSYGCGDEDEMTYFGKAYLRHGLWWKHSFEESFAEAASLIRRWELRDELSHSNPQIHVGSEIRAKLDALERRGARKETLDG